MFLDIHKAELDNHPFRLTISTPTPTPGQNQLVTPLLHIGVDVSFCYQGRLDYSLCPCGRRWDGPVPSCSDDHVHVHLRSSVITVHAVVYCRREEHGGLVERKNLQNRGVQEQTTETSTS